jgi:hypothetical protein
MDDIITKDIEIVTWEKSTAKNGNPMLKIIDQHGVKYTVWPKKKDGELSIAGSQWKDMGLDEGSRVCVSYVVENFTFEGKEITSNKAIGFRETSNEIVKSQTPKPSNGVAKSQTPIYHKEDTDQKELAVGKCASLFLQALISSGATFEDAHKKIPAAFSLARDVVYYKETSEEAPLPE